MNKTTIFDSEIFRSESDEKYYNMFYFTTFILKNLLVFGGKGGVGKSSISCATAAYLAEQMPDQKILLISFDIAHNLSDIFQVQIGTNLTQITANLWGIEPDPDVFAEKSFQSIGRKNPPIDEINALKQIYPRS